MASVGLGPCVHSGSGRPWFDGKINQSDINIHCIFVCYVNLVNFRYVLVNGKFRKIDNYPLHGELIFWSSWVHYKPGFSEHNVVCPQRRSSRLGLSNIDGISFKLNT